MRRTVSLFGTLLCCSIAVAQVISSSLASSDKATENPKPFPKTAELALDGAKRWTQAAIEDAANISPLERDVLLIHLAGNWTGIDRERAQNYLNNALARLKLDALPDSSISNRNNYNFAILTISGEVRELDREAWDKLMDEVPDSEASDAISREAQELAVSDDLAGAMELERKSLERGGSMSDTSTLSSMIENDPASAGKLFDEILQAVPKPTTDPNLLASLVQDVFRDDSQPTAQDFFNQERKQRILDLIAQLTLPGKQGGGCNYSFAAGFVMQRFPPQLQGELEPIIADCKHTSTNAWGNEIERAGQQSTDDLVAAMEAAPDTRTKASLRERAILHAASADHDFPRAIRLCLEASQAEREQSPESTPRHDSWASMYASQMVQSAIRNHDDLTIQNVLAMLPARLRAEVDLLAVGRLSRTDTSQSSQAVLLLDDASKALQAEAPLRAETFVKYLWLTSKLSPENVNSAWRTVVAGLNGFNQAQRRKADAMGLRKGLPDRNLQRFDPLNTWVVPDSSILDESFVRASIDDLNSPEYREQFRIGMIQAFLSHYEQALKDPAKTKGTRLPTSNP